MTHLAAAPGSPEGLVATVSVLVAEVVDDPLAVPVLVPVPDVEVVLVVEVEVPELEVPEVEVLVAEEAAASPRGPIE